MKKLLLLFIFLVAANSYAQIDSQGGSVNLEGFDVEEEEEEEDNPETNLDMENNFSLSENHSLSNLNFGFTPLPTPRYFSDETEKPMDLREKDAGFDKYIVDVDPGYLREQREMREAYSTEQNLGSANTGSVVITVMYRDHQMVDGDRVRIRINDEILMPNAVLDGGWNGFTYNLNDGINRISFEALNMGTSGPNTAAFQITGDAGELIAKNEWNLTTGAEAIFIVVKH